MGSPVGPAGDVLTALRHREVSVPEGVVQGDEVVEAAMLHGGALAVGEVVPLNSRPASVVAVAICSGGSALGCHLKQQGYRRSIIGISPVISHVIFRAHLIAKNRADFAIYLNSYLSP